MYYLMHELNHAAMTPFRALADATRLTWRNPANPLSYTPAARSIAAGAELFERVTRRYAKPEFGLDETVVDGVPHMVREQKVWSRSFCDLIHFERFAPADADAPAREDPKLLIVAPMSGHYATLLRGTVEAMLPHAEVFITDWRDARMVPLTEGGFDLDDYIDYVIGMLEHLGPDTHVMAVCQPAVPVLAAVARMEAEDHPDVPASMTLMGGPIDTRINPTAVNELAEEKPIEWFERRVIMQVPWPNPGFLRRVYPGFLQLGGFMSMNLDRHVTAHREFFEHLVENDGDSAEKHRDFYDEYLAVMDLTAEFYLQTVETVFIEHSLPKGTMTHRGKPVEPSAIKRTALLTIEGENDDISGVGQTAAAHELCSAIPVERREHHVQEKVGHYGIFNGSRFRSQIVPRVVAFMERNAKALDGAAEPEAKVVARPTAKAEAEAVEGGNVVLLEGARTEVAERRRRKVAGKAEMPLEADAQGNALGAEAKPAKVEAKAPAKRGRKPAKGAASVLPSKAATAGPDDGGKPVAASKTAKPSAEAKADAPAAASPTAAAKAASASVGKAAAAPVKAEPAKAEPAKPEPAKAASAPLAASSAKSASSSAKPAASPAKAGSGRRKGSIGSKLAGSTAAIPTAMPTLNAAPKAAKDPAPAAKADTPAKADQKPADDAETGAKADAKKSDAA